MRARPPRPVALIIADLRMPGMTGPELLSRARSLHPLAKRALIIDTCDFISKELARAMTLGQADSWLTKPWVPPDQLLYPLVVGLLSEWLDDMKPRRPDAIQVVGGRWAGRSHELSDVLDRNQLPYITTPARRSARG